MNEVEVCNLALGRIGQGASRPIQSLTENSEAARACNRVFDSALETTLREFPWAFAQVSVALATVPQEVPGWGYVYAYPEDCLFLHGLASEDCDPMRSGFPAVDRRLLSATSGESLVIVTDLPDAWAHYTRRVANPHFGDVMFQDALAWRLAFEVALGLKADPRMAQNAAGQFTIAISKAASADQREFVLHERRLPEDVAAYGGVDVFGNLPRGWHP